LPIHILDDVDISTSAHGTISLDIWDLLQHSMELVKEATRITVNVEHGYDHNKMGGFLLADKNKVVFLFFQNAI
jgi:hypothetical protein